jgi:hypothetical protein
MIGTIDQAALQLRTVARAAYAQESTYSDDDGADLTLATTPADSEETELGLGCPQSGSAVTCSGNFLQGRLGFSAGTTRSSKPSPSQAGSYRALRLVFQILGIVGRVSLQGCLQLKGVNSDHLPL